MAYSNAQLQSLWIKAGGNPRSAPLAAAVALAESGGDNGNVGDGGTSFSVWQIHTPAHPQYSASRLKSDPLYAAKAAVAISNNGRDWNPWTTYFQGTYRQFLTGAKQAPIPGITDPPKPAAPRVTGLGAGATPGANVASQALNTLLATQKTQQAGAMRTAGTAAPPTAGESPLPDPGFSRAYKVMGGAQLPQLGPPTPPQSQVTDQQIAAVRALGATTAGAAAKTTGVPGAPQLGTARPTAPRAPYSSPVPKGMGRGGGRTDNGVDFELRVGTPLLAVGSGKIVNTQGEFPGGSIVLQLDRPINGFRYVYYGHLNDASKRVRVGQRVNAGDMVARTSSRPPGAEDIPGHTEIGFARSSGGEIQTGGHAEGPTGWGNIFSNWLKSQWRV